MSREAYAKKVTKQVESILKANPTKSINAKKLPEYEEIAKEQQRIFTELSNKINEAHQNLNKENPTFEEVKVPQVNKSLLWFELTEFSKQLSTYNANWFQGVFANIKTRSAATKNWLSQLEQMVKATINRVNKLSNAAEKRRKYQRRKEIY